MSEAAQITDKSAFERKSLGKQVVFSIVTLGLYPLYWFYLMWQVSNAAEAVTDQSAVILFVVFLFLSPLSWYWVQSGMNQVAAS